jgi:hypothetical protein
MLARREPEIGAMLCPVNRVQSPSSTASANPVSVEIPRRQHTRRVTAVNSLASAIAVICASSRSRRARVISIASRSASKAAAVAGRSNPIVRIHASCAAVHARPPAYTCPCRSSSLDSRCRTRIKSPRASSRARTRSRAASSTTDGTRTAVNSPNRSSRANSTASRASVLTRSPAGRVILLGAATVHPIPAAVRARANPNPVGPAS